MRRDKNWAHKVGSWKYLTTLRPVFPRAQSASSLSGRVGVGGWKSAAVAARDLVLVKADAECRFVVDSHLLHTTCIVPGQLAPRGRQGGKGLEWEFSLCPLSGLDKDQEATIQDWRGIWGIWRILRDKVSVDGFHWRAWIFQEVLVLNNLAFCLGRIFLNGKVMLMRAVEF